LSIYNVNKLWKFYPRQAWRGQFEAVWTNHEFKIKRESYLTQSFAIPLFELIIEMPLLQNLHRHVAANHNFISVPDYLQLERFHISPTNVGAVPE
jgi:hypothetical protein